MASLNADQLDAFFEVARAASFSKAARVLGLSQPALSHRVHKLEDQLGTALLVRNGRQAEVTEAGRQLLGLCRMRREQEAELVRSLHAEEPGKLSGVARIAAYSSISRSLVLPALSDLLTHNPGVRLELLVLELRELPGALRKLQADFVFTDHPIAFAGVVARKVGEEEYVLAGPARGKVSNPELYFDHDLDDRTTADFWKGQAKPPKRFERAFAGEIYAILDAVERGWGWAVAPRHLVRERAKLKVRSELPPMRVPIYLNYFEQPYYSALRTALIEKLSRLG